jgi:hypothetical protein
VVAVLEEANNGDGVPITGPSVVSPNASLDQAEANGVGWWVRHFIGSFDIEAMENVHRRLRRARSSLDVM